MKILALDIETSPSLAYVWALWKQDIAPSQLVEPTEMLCFAARFLGEKKMYYFSPHKVDRHAIANRGGYLLSADKQGMVAAAHALLDEADVVLHYNGVRFDIPHLNREFIQQGLGPPSPYKQIDLWQVVSRRFNFPSNKLEYVAPALGLKGKVETGGFSLWKKCMAGDLSAWRKMERYNKQDVRVLEELYEKLLPWIPNHPHRGLYDGQGECPTCGAVGSLQKRGTARTQLSTYQRWHCTACGGWFRSGRRQGGVDVRPEAS